MMIGNANKQKSFSKVLKKSYKKADAPMLTLKFSWCMQKKNASL